MASYPGSFIVSVLLLGGPGCRPETSDDTGAATEATSTGSASPGTGVDAPTTGAGSSTDGSSTDGSSGGGTSTTGDGSTGGSSESGDMGTTGSGAACGLVEQACAAVEALGEYEDCGVVDPWNDLAPAWQAARDCAIKAASEQRAFKLVTWLKGFDSQVGQAYVGLTAESYSIVMFHFDSDPCGGGGCGPVASQGSCSALVAVPACVVEPGGPCLACTDQSEPVQICGPREGAMFPLVTRW